MISKDKKIAMHSFAEDGLLISPLKGTKEDVDNMLYGFVEAVPPKKRSLLGKLFARYTNG